MKIYEDLRVSAHSNIFQWTNTKHTETDPYVFEVIKICSLDLNTVLSVPMEGMRNVCAELKL